MSTPAHGPLDWDFSAPQSPALGDHEVEELSGHLRGQRIALLVCGGVAAMRSVLLVRALRRRGAQVQVFCSADALRFVGREALEWASAGEVITHLTWRAEHLGEGAGFAAYVVAPATYNSIGKAAQGIADSLIAAVLASALGRLQRGQSQVLMVPTMHGSMHHQVLTDNCRRLAAMGVRFVRPLDSAGKHHWPAEDFIVAAVCASLSQGALRDQPALVCASTQPQALALAQATHEALLLAGAHSQALLCAEGWSLSSSLPQHALPNREPWRAACEAALESLPKQSLVVMDADMARSNGAPQSLRTCFLMARSTLLPQGADKPLWLGLRVIAETSPWQWQVLGSGLDQAGHEVLLSQGPLPAEGSDWTAWRGAAAALLAACAAS